MDKPPIGITPRIIVAEHRAVEICDAIARYAMTGHAIPVEWTRELSDLIRWRNLHISTGQEVNKSV